MQTLTLESMLLGRAMAAMSHELKNVLAIIGEAAGLMEDILEITREQGTGLPDAMEKRFGKALGSVGEQVARGHRLTSDMNTVAHFPDRRHESGDPDVDIGESMGLAMRLCLRRASQGKVSLKGPGPTGAALAADPLHCLTTLLALLEWALENCAPETELAANALADRPVCELSGAMFPETLPPDLEALAEAAGLEIRAEKERVRVTLKGSRK